MVTHPLHRLASGARPAPAPANSHQLNPLVRYHTLTRPAVVDMESVAPLEALTFVTWKWHQPGFREPYTAAHVNIMHAMLTRHTQTPFRHICITDDAKGLDKAIDVHPIWNDMNKLANACGHHLPSCYRRLKIFSPIVQKAMGISKGRIVSIDLDAVITNTTDALWHRNERFVGWARRGSRHPTVFNGSMFMFTVGDLENIWTEFDPIRSPTLANRAGFMGSDQSWLSYKLMQQKYIGGFGPAVQSFPDMRRAPLRASTSVVFFHGRTKPWHSAAMADAPWIKQHWRQ